MESVWKGAEITRKWKSVTHTDVRKKRNRVQLTNEFYVILLSSCAKHFFFCYCYSSPTQQICHFLLLSCLIFDNLSQIRPFSEWLKQINFLFFALPIPAHIWFIRIYHDWEKGRFFNVDSFYSSITLWRTVQWIESFLLVELMWREVDY